MAWGQRSTHSRTTATLGCRDTLRSAVCSGAKPSSRRCGNGWTTASRGTLRTPSARAFACSHCSCGKSRALNWIGVVVAALRDWRFNTASVLASWRSSTGCQSLKGLDACLSGDSRQPKSSCSADGNLATADARLPLLLSVICQHRSASKAWRYPRTDIPRP
jgi:hypothetical protein